MIYVLQHRNKMAVLFRHNGFSRDTELPPPRVSLTRPVTARCAVLTIVGCLHIRDQYTGVLSCAWQQTLSFNLHKSDLPSTITNLTCFQIFNPFTIRFIKTSFTYSVHHYWTREQKQLCPKTNLHFKAQVILLYFKLPFYFLVVTTGKR